MNDSTPTPSRRDFLRKSIGVVGTFAATSVLLPIAGCSSDSGNPVTPPNGDTEMRLDTSSGTYAALANAGSFMAVNLPNGTKVNVFRLSATQATTLSRLCTHEQCDLGPASSGTLVGTQIICGCHGSRFDAATGARLAGPATSALRTWSTRIDGAEIIITL